MWPNSQFPTDLVTFIGEIVNGKLHFLCSVSPGKKIRKHQNLSKISICHAYSVNTYNKVKDNFELKERLDLTKTCWENEYVYQCHTRNYISLEKPCIFAYLRCSCIIKFLSFRWCYIFLLTTFKSCNTPVGI